MPDTPSTLQWSAYEHEHVERGGDWFWALGIVAVCVAVTSILFHDTLFGVLVILAAGTIGLLANVPPEVVEFEISERGIRVGKVLHRYDDIISFWVEDEHGAPLLLVDTTKFMSPNLVIPIEGLDPGDVRTLLLQHALEVPMKEPFAHKILEFFGF
jgi:hypothetical protein